ncbi:hypothetical protein AtNW77_Chr1g0055621 [Arabidopsis thaliana]
MNRQVLSLITLIILLVSAYNTTMGRTLPREGNGAQQFDNLKAGVRRSESARTRQKGPGH